MAFADIIEIVAPESAVAGERVDIEVKIKNTWSSAMGVMVSANLDYGVSPWPSVNFPYNWLTLGPGETHSFPGWFIMPASEVIIRAYSFYESDGVWYDDDWETKEVTLAEVYAGTIIGIELEYDEAQAGIPVYNIPQGERGLVHVWGRNDMSTTQDLGIRWLVYDPDGVLVEDYFDWSYGHGPSDDHEFIGGRFNLDKPGTYTINIALAMNPADPETVDTYYGDLCTVAAAVPEPEFRGFGVREYSTV